MSFLGRLFSGWGRAEDAPVIPGFAQQDGTGEDAPASAATAPNAAIDGLVFGLEYGDAQGVVTRRIIRLIGYEFGRDSDAVLLLHCWCQLRADRRCFRSDRILALFDHRSGHRIDDHLALLDRVTGAGRRRAHGRAMMELEPLLAALLWIARADGLLDEREIAAMADFACAEAALRAPPLDIDRAAIAEWFRRRRVVFDEIADELARLGGDAPALDRFADGVLAVIKADGEVDRREMSRMRKVIRHAVTAREALRQ